MALSHKEKKEMTKFGQKADARMKELGWDQKTLAEKSGVPASSLNRYISTNEPRMDIVVRVSEALGVEPTYFTEATAKSIEPYDEVISVIGRCKGGLSAEQKTRIIEILIGTKEQEG